MRDNKLGYHFEEYSVTLCLQFLDNDFSLN